MTVLLIGLIIGAAVAIFCMEVERHANRDADSDDWYADADRAIAIVTDPARNLRVLRGGRW